MQIVSKPDLKIRNSAQNRLLPAKTPAFNSESDLLLNRIEGVKVNPKQ